MEQKPENYKLFEPYFYASEDVQALLAEKRRLTNERKLVEALHIGKVLERLEKERYEHWLQLMTEKAKQLDPRSAGIEGEDLQTLKTLYVTAFMACDIIESVVIDANDIVKKVNKDYHIDEFDELAKLNKAAQNKLDFLHKATGLLSENYWGNICDDMYKMMQNKARKIISKKESQ